MATLKNKWVQLLLVFVLGLAVGAIFYPSKEEEYKKKVSETSKRNTSLHKQLEERAEIISELSSRLEEQESTFLSFREESSAKIDTLRTENRQLRSSARRQTFKIVKPDGTIIEKELEESSSEEITSVVTEVREEFDRKVESIESKWKSIHKSRVEKLKEEYEKKLKEKKVETKVVEKTVEKEKIVKVNERKLRTDLGYSSDNRFYLHATYPLFGPVFLGGGASSDKGFSDSEARLGIGMEW